MSWLAGAFTPEIRLFHKNLVIDPSMFGYRRYDSKLDLALIRNSQ
jgi:hypothetical protein